MPYYYIDNNFGKARGIHNNLDRFIIDFFVSQLTMTKIEL